MYVRFLRYLRHFILSHGDFPGGSVVKPPNTGDLGSIPGLGRPPWRRRWQPTSVFLPGKSHEQRSLVGYSPRGCRVGHNLAIKAAAAAYYLIIWLIIFIKFSFGIV